MKFRLVVLSLALWVVIGPATAAAREPDRVSINGHSRVRLTDWARANGFDFRWLQREKTLEVTNRTARLVLGVDSREARINGVKVWLLQPLLLRGGEVWLAQLDAETTLRPLLFPIRNPPGAKIKTIYLDPGHGGKDPGNRVSGDAEKRYTLLLAEELRAQLQQAGFKVNLTRRTDTFIDLAERPAAARRGGADLFVSLHFNATAGDREQAQGAEVYALTPAGASSTAAPGEKGGNNRSSAGNKLNEKNILLAYQIQKALLRRLPVADRGVRRARFAVLRDATMPAVLVEGGFMTHPAEGKKISAAAYRRDMARAIRDGIVAYQRIVERGS